METILWLNTTQITISRWSILNFPAAAVPYAHCSYSRHIQYIVLVQAACMCHTWWRSQVYSRPLLTHTFFFSPLSYVQCFTSTSEGPRKLIFSRTPYFDLNGRIFLKIKSAHGIQKYSFIYS